MGPAWFNDFPYSTRRNFSAIKKMSYGLRSASSFIGWQGGSPSFIGRPGHVSPVSNRFPARDEEPAESLHTERVWGFCKKIFSHKFNFNHLAFMPISHTVCIFSTFYTILSKSKADC